jgi:hypothetical protein
MRVLRILTACGFISVAVASPAVAADAVLEWNEIAVTNVDAGGRGPAGILDMAKVHLAIHDAVQAYFHNAETYCADIDNASGSASAAVAAAARDVLVALLPPAQDTAVITVYNTYLSTNGLVGNAGIAVGQQAAACILNLRMNDGSFPTVNPSTFFGGTNPGEWRPTTPTPTSMVAPWLANVTPFAAKSSDQFGVNSPPKNLKSGIYAREYNEVKTLGGKTSTALTIVTRTGAQTELANFFSEPFLVLIQRVARDILNRYGRDLSESARALALANVAAADAIIGTWGAKIEFNFWRPITAIRQGHLDGNAQTDADPAWEPFLTTPNYPDHPSGANNLTSSIMRTMELFFRSDRLPFTAETKAAAAAQKFRPYESFTDFRHDVVDVRIYQGIHFRTADEVAFVTGQQSADWAFSHILRPIH